MPRPETPSSGAMIAYLTAYILTVRQRRGFPRYIWYGTMQRAAIAVRRDWGW